MRDCKLWKPGEGGKFHKGFGGFGSRGAVLDCVAVTFT
jgi:hypothetical protein